MRTRKIEDTDLKYILKYENLQLGDVILESGHKLHSYAIKKYTKSNFSHIMIFIGNMSIIHAEKKGIFSLNPQRLLVKNSNDLKVLRLKENLSDNEKRNLEAFLRNKVGSLYSVKEALLIVKNNTTQQSSNEYQFCSRLVAQAYNSINYKIVDNIDFCSPADIEISNLFYEVENIVRKAENHDIHFALTKNSVKANQISMYDWLNKTRDIAYKEYQFNINNINDVDSFLQKFPNNDKIVCYYINTSGYLETYLIEVKNNPHMHDQKKFLDKFQNIDNIIHALSGEFKNIPFQTNRHIDNYKNSILNYNQTKLKYYELHINLYKALLGVSLSKFITLFEVSKQLISEGVKDDTLTLIMMHSQNNIEVLQELGIERYDKFKENN